MGKHLFDKPIPSISRPLAWPPSGNPARPLSDIREQTEPSLVDVVDRKPPPEGSIFRKGSVRRAGSAKSARPAPAERISDDCGVEQDSSGSLPSGRQDRTSVFEVPTGSVPPRASSHRRRRRRHHHHRRSTSCSGDDAAFAPTSTALPTPPTPAPRPHGRAITDRGRSKSPVKNSIARFEAVTSGASRRVPSRTYHRQPLSTSIIERPVHNHPRVRVELHVGASLFVGGGSIEGHVRVVVDDTERVRHKRALAVSRTSVDLVGIEEMTGWKKSVFLNLATELIDPENPPPRDMVESPKQISPIDPFWHLAPSISVLPFLLSLPLDVGPPPFRSRHARIRYMLTATMLIRDQGKQYLVRASQNVSVISVYDPEKALTSLPSPLTAMDEYVRGRGDDGIEIVRLMAGLHRQVWVSGTCLFVDAHVANSSRKTIKRLELQLERDILCYKHAAATTLEKSASQARIFDTNERSILSKTVYKQGHRGWNGVAPHTAETRTCDLEIPRGHATVKCGKYFEVRYFLNILVSTTRTKLVAVQLPIVLIHMNSLDVVPNAVAQVAAAIEEKRSAAAAASALQESSSSPSLLFHSRRPHDRAPSRARSPFQSSPLRRSSSHARSDGSHHRRRLRRQTSQRTTNSVATASSSVQGRAFAAPRMQSLDRMRAQAEDLLRLGRALDSSPRKAAVAASAASPRLLPSASGRKMRGSDKENGGRAAATAAATSAASASGASMAGKGGGGWVRRCQSGWDYRTPPSNRKGRVLDGDDAEQVKRRLRGMRSAETVCGSSGSNSKDNNSNDRRGASVAAAPPVLQAKSRAAAGPSNTARASAFKFREAEVSGEEEKGSGENKDDNVEKRSDGDRGDGAGGQRPARQWQFGRKKSKDSWRGVAWLMAERDRDKMSSNWI